MLLSQYIMVSGIIIGYLAILGVIAFISYVAVELMLMKARGVKIVRKKRH